MPAAPTGAKVVSAKLTVRTTTDSFAGSVDAHSVNLTSDNWTKGTLAWSNKPALGHQVGSFPANSTNTAVAASLDPALIDAEGSGTLSLGVTSASADNIWFWARTHSSASYRPALTVVYEVP